MHWKDIISAFWAGECMGGGGGESLCVGRNHRCIGGYHSVHWDVISVQCIDGMSSVH